MVQVWQSEADEIAAIIESQFIPLMLLVSEAKRSGFEGETIKQIRRNLTTAFHEIWHGWSYLYRARRQFELLANTTERAGQNARGLGSKRTQRKDGK